jgi:hypothetical protein
MLIFLKKKTSINGMLKECPGELVNKTLLINIKKWTFAFYTKKKKKRTIVGDSG